MQEEHLPDVFILLEKPSLDPTSNSSDCPFLSSTLEKNPKELTIFAVTDFFAHISTQAHCHEAPPLREDSR